MCSHLRVTVNRRTLYTLVFTPGLQVAAARILCGRPQRRQWSVVVIAGPSALLVNFDGLKSRFAAKTAEAGAQRASHPGKAKRRPDRSLWEKDIQKQLNTLRATETWRLEKSSSPGWTLFGRSECSKRKKKIRRETLPLQGPPSSLSEGIDILDSTYTQCTHL